MRARPGAERLPAQQVALPSLSRFRGLLSGGRESSGLKIFQLLEIQKVQFIQSWKSLGMENHEKDSSEPGDGPPPDALVDDLAKKRIFKGGVLLGFEQVPEMVKLVYKLGPGVAEGQMITIGGEFHIGIIPGVPFDFPKEKAERLVTAKRGRVDYVHEKDRPVKPSDSLPPEFRAKIQKRKQG